MVSCPLAKKVRLAVLSLAALPSISSHLAARLSGSLTCPKRSGHEAAKRSCFAACSATDASMEKGATVETKIPLERR